MKFLKQSTQAVVPMGPFVDKSDGVTLKADATCVTDIDHATTGIFLIKNGGTGAIRHQAIAAASVADSYGMMLVTLDATDTGTLGRLRVMFAKAATYLPVWEDFQVLPAAIFDSLVTGSGGAIPNIAAGSTNGLFIAGTNAATVITTSLTTTFTGNLTGTTAKSPASVAAGDVSGNLPVDVQTIKTQAVTCAAGVTVLAQVGAGGAPGTSGGLPTTDGTKLNQTVDLTAAQSIACSDKTGFSLSSTGADLILKSSTFIQAIVAALNEFATYGLTALNTLLVTTGIKAATVPAVTLANGAHGGAAATLTLSGAVGLVATKIDAPLNGNITGNMTGNITGTLSTVTTCTNMRGTDNAMLATAKPTVGGYDTGQDPVTLMNANPPDVNVKTETNHDFTALQKTSLNAATPASVQSYGTLVADIATAVWGAATRTLSAFAFTVAATVASVPDSAGVTTLLARLGAFTGTGINTILGFFKALMGKAAANPSDLGALTFDAATDSVEGIRDTAPLGTAMVAAAPSKTDIAAEVLLEMNTTPPDVNSKTITDAAIKSTTFTSGAIDAAALATDAGQEIADAYLDRANAIETGLTPRNQMRLVAASASGDLSGAGTGTEVLKSAKSGAKSRITATVDVDGNRTIATDLT